MLITSSVQLSHKFMSDSVTPWTAAHQASVSITNSWSLLQTVTAAIKLKDACSLEEKLSPN